MRKGFIGVFLITMSFLLAACSVKEDAENVVEDITGDPAGEIIVLKDEYKPGEEIRLAYTMDSDSLSGGTIRLMSDGGVAGIKNTSNDNNANNNNQNQNVSEEKSFDKKIGVLSFTAPNQPGTYEISMHAKDLDNSSDSGMDELASITIEVVDPQEETRSLDADMEISKDSYAPGETITVNYTAASTFDNSAWIGIVPSIIEHGNERKNFESKLSHQNISGNKGTVTLKAPDQPGVYDLRMHNSTKDGMEVEDIRITVK